MNSLLETLYLYACENRSMDSREGRLQRLASSRITEQARKDIMDMLPEEGQRRFSDYISKEHTLQELELENIFRAGLSIGLELSRL